MKLTIGFSPCPNDTFIFDALVNGKIDNGDLEFEALLEDVETLNKWASEEKLDITKLSFPALFQNQEKYALLNSGSAMGKGVGPILITKHPHPHLQPSSLAAAGQASNIRPGHPGGQPTVALPGKHTTANLLFSLAYPELKKKRFMIFSSIEAAVLNEEVDLGVIIHENRFTYEQKGLLKVQDLGEFWEEKMKMPIPLGGIAIRRSLENEFSIKINSLIRKSVEYSFARYPVLSSYVKDHAQNMDEEIMRKHIDLYVNDFTLDLGDEGRKAIEILFEVYRGMINPEAKEFLFTT